MHNAENIFILDGSTMAFTAKSECFLARSTLFARIII
jgi:hypothetical protein